jgi:DNA-binding Xre family transcriptional regulator
MKANYNKLFKLLIDKKLKKGELCDKAGISTFSLGRLAKGGNVSMDILVKICGVLSCTVDDIMEIVPDEKAAEEKGNDENK